MTPEELARLHAAGIYDPHADDATEQVAVLERLESRGVGSEAILSADRLGTLVFLGFEHLIRPGRRSTVAEVSELTGTPSGELRRLWRAWGFPDAAPDEACWTEADVEAAAFIERAKSIAGVDPIFALVRSAGTAMARIAESEIAFVRSKIEAPMLESHAARASLLRQYERVIEAMLPDAERMLATLHRHHLVSFRRHYEQALRPSESNVRDVVVGFADMTDSTALVERLHLNELDHALAVFDERTTDVIAAGGATLVKRLGDGVMFVALDATAACRLALDLVAAFPAEESLPPVRVGLAAGMVAALRGDYFGPAVHRAARIVAMAAPRSVLVADEIPAAASAGDLDFAPIGPRTLTGFDRPVELSLCRRRP